MAGALLTRQLAGLGVDKTRHAGAKTMLLAIVLTPLALLIEFGLFEIIVRGEWRFGFAFFGGCVPDHGYHRRSALQA